MNRTSRFFQTTFFFLLCLAPALASAKSERYVLHYGDSTFSSSNHKPVTLFLKRELKHQHPGIDLSRYRLEKVVIMAKSRKGRGSAQLLVNERYGPRVRISGSPKAFHNSDRFNYEKKTLFSPSGPGRGPWQLKLKGNVKLRKVVLVVDKEKRRKKNDGYYGYKPSGPAYHPIVLPARAWGTRLEGERSCGSLSRNARDGWDSPDSICSSYGKAVFRSGYRPTRLYVRPDISPLGSRKHRYVRNLGISVSLADFSRGWMHADSVILGIDIGGRTFTRRIVLSGNMSRQRSATGTLTITGKWSRRDVAGSRIWIMPESSGDIAVKQLQIRVNKVS